VSNSDSPGSTSDVRRPRGWALPAFAGVLLFLLGNLTVRAAALVGSGLQRAMLLGAVLAVVSLCLARPRWLAPALTLFGASFFLYGFHSYRIQNQAFELTVAVLALVLLLARWRPAEAADPATAAARADARVGTRWIVGLWLLYALLSLLSLLLLPPAVLGERVFLEAADLPLAVLRAFPQDPLYPLAAVNRLLLFVAFTGLLSRHPEARLLYRALFRGIAGAVVIAVVLGLLEFAGLVSLSRYNLSGLFYGARYRRLQSTFGNPSWFACFVTCAPPFVLLELWEARRSCRVLLAAFVPLCAASLFLSGARAAWLGAGVLALGLAAITIALRRAGTPLPALGRELRVAALVTGAGVALGAAAVYFPSGEPSPSASTERLPGLARELRIRGSGLNSPRTVTARYALALARQGPWLGLGHETFALHLGAQLALPSSPVARVRNAAVAADASEVVFDDAHSTYLQVLAGTGLAGLALWLALAAAGLLLVARSLRARPDPASACVLLALVVFHFYGLFQGMQYIVVTWFLLHVALGYAATLAEGLPRPVARGLDGGLAALLALVLGSGLVYASDRGWERMRQDLRIGPYLPDERDEFVGFYRPERGPEGEFRWMARRGIVHVSRAAPFRLQFACEDPDTERSPLQLSLSFDGQGQRAIVFRRPGTVEQRFDFGRPGTLRLEVSRTFRPAGHDRRELGVSVSAIRWE
jgi:O-antigen ligase